MPEGALKVCPAMAAITFSQALCNHLGIKLTTRLTDFSGYWILIVAVALTIAMIRLRGHSRRTTDRLSRNAFKSIRALTVFSMHSNTLHEGVEDAFPGRLIEAGALEQAGEEVGVAHVDLDRALKSFPRSLKLAALLMNQSQVVVS